jgi:hypothetical protein
MKRRVITPKNLPSRLPLSLTIALGLLLDRCDAPGWVWGAVSALMVFIWVCALVGMLSEEYVEALK